MKVMLIDLNKILEVKEIQPILSRVIIESPDVIVFVGYKREFQEDVLHPVQKMMGNSQSEVSDDSLVIWKDGITDFSFIKENILPSKAPVLIIEI